MAANEGLTPAQKRAQKAYAERNERINPFFPKGTMDRIRALGYTPNAFVKEAAMQKLQEEEDALREGRSNGKGKANA